MARFFKLPKNSSFSYKPRFYDPAKEELEERISNFENKDPNNKEAMKARITGGFKTRGGYNRGFAAKRNKSVRRSNAIRLVLIVALLALAIILISEKLPNFTRFLEGG